MQQNINPTIFVVFGATGDLMKKKIISSIFHLWKKDMLPKLFHVVGVSRSEMEDDEFRDFVFSVLKEKGDAKSVSGKTAQFLKMFTYSSGKFEDKKTYNKLAEKIGVVDGGWNKACSNKLFYLAVPPTLYKFIFNNISSSGLTALCSRKDGWTRVLVEKPFGKDFKTARELDLLLGKLFREEQIFRIDHYLGKEMLQNILAFRFSNNLFEQSFNNNFIEKINIRLLEKLGVETRGAFYDGVGALKDVGQNHLLQMLALVTMDQPLGLDSNSIRNNRAKILKQLKPISRMEIKEMTFRGQYDGYRKIKDVKSNSKTETYFKVIGHLDSDRWSGVPITMEGGKSLLENRKEIEIVFRHSMPCLLCPGSKEHYNNKIVISMEPEEKISIEFFSKLPGIEMKIAKKSFDFMYRNDKKKRQYTEEYEKLLYDCVAGDQTLFVNTEEVEAMWQFIDPIVSVWKTNIVPLVNYRPHTNQILEKAILGESDMVSNKTMKMEIGIIGLGKMGGGIAQNLLEKSWNVVGYNLSSEPTKALKSDGLIDTYSIKDLVVNLGKKKVVWIMVPAGKPTNSTIKELLKYLKSGDMVIDGGNSYYRDSIRHAKNLAKRGIKFVDVGVSGGPYGARHGASLMIGGKKTDFEYLRILFSHLAVYQGYQHFEGNGAGHFVKMVHNGIEYGMMQAIAEGFTIMKKSKYNLDLKKITAVYNHGSVIESSLIGWMQDALQLYGDDLSPVSGSVSHTGEGQWTIKTAKSMKLKSMVIEEAYKFRIMSEKNPSYTGKIVSALRNQFGGHSINGNK